MIDITAQVQEEAVSRGGGNGVCIVYVPHTTAGVTINEGADPAVCSDILQTLERLVPKDPAYHHLEGNSDSHLKTSLIGSSVTVILEDGRLLLGTWQKIFFCEFDGPRTRRVEVRVYGTSVV